MLNSVLLIVSAMIVSIVFLWSGAWLTWAYYATDMATHDMLFIVGPMLVLIGFASPFAIIEELK